jgi:hypothetical protein
MVSDGRKISLQMNTMSSWWFMLSKSQTNVECHMKGCEIFDGLTSFDYETIMYKCKAIKDYNKESDFSM